LLRLLRFPRLAILNADRERPFPLLRLQDVQSTAPPSPVALVLVGRCLLRPGFTESRPAKRLPRFAGPWRRILKSYLTMRATRPAARPSHSLFKLRSGPLNVLPSGFRFLDRDNPADPFIARERRNVLPCCPRLRVRNEGLSQIRWHFMYDAARDCFSFHGFILSAHMVRRDSQIGRFSCERALGLQRKFGGRLEATLKSSPEPSRTRDDSTRCHRRTLPHAASK